MNDTLKQAEELKEETVAWRQQLHAMPEPSFKEQKTASFVAAKLTEFGYEVKTGIAGTGVVAELGTGNLIALRAELDGLAMPEANPVEYVSQIEGYSHACGHDANMACVLSAAKLLAKETPNCRVRIIMQPASEVASDENMKSGALRMIEDGVIDGVEALLGIHADGTIESGKVGIIKEPVVAKSDQFEILLQFTKKEKLPPLRIMSMASRIVNRIYDACTSSSLQELDLESLSVDSVNLESEEGNTAKIRGSLNYQSKDMFNSIESALENACKAEIQSDYKYSIRFEAGHPAMMDTHVVDKLYQSSKSLLREENVRLLTRKTWSEDFSVYSCHLPSAMVLLGTQIPGPPRVHHSSNFDINDDNLHLGAAILVETVKALANSPVTA